MVKKMYPLSSGQKVLYYGLSHRTTDSVTNICGMLCFECEVDPALVAKAMKIALKQMKATSTRLTVPDGKVPMQYFSDEEPQDIEILDFSDDQKKLDKYIKKQSETGFPNAALETRLYKIALIKKPDGFYGLYVCVSHIICDAFSFMQLASNVVRIYAALRDSQPVPEFLSDPRDVFEYDRQYEGSEQEKKDIEFWNSEVYGTEPMYSSITGYRHLKKGSRMGKLFSPLHPGAKFICRKLDKELVDKVNAFSAERRLSPQCIYWLALRNYISKVSENQDDIVFYSTVAKRWNLSLKKAGGTVAQMIPVRLSIPSETSFIEACKVTEQTKFRYYRHANLSSILMNKAAREKYGRTNTEGYITAMITYQPYFVEQVESVPFHIQHISNGVNIQQLYMTVMAYDHSGDLYCNYDFNTHLIKPEDIEALHGYIVRFLRTCVENPDMTLAQLRLLS